LEAAVDDDDHPDQKTGRNEREHRVGDGEAQAFDDPNGDEDPDENVDSGQAPGAQIHDTIVSLSEDLGGSGRGELHRPVAPSKQSSLRSFRFRLSIVRRRSGVGLNHA
jgi:hypothetical protein